MEVGVGTWELCVPSPPDHPPSATLFRLIDDVLALFLGEDRGRRDLEAGQPTSGPDIALRMCPPCAGWPARVSSVSQIARQNSPPPPTYHRLNSLAQKRCRGGRSRGSHLARRRASPETASVPAGAPTR
eukprot:247570-Rhodomonas_salina.3